MLKVIVQHPAEIVTFIAHSRNDGTTHVEHCHMLVATWCHYLLLLALLQATVTIFFKYMQTPLAWIWPESKLLPYTSSTPPHICHCSAIICDDLQRTEKKDEPLIAQRLVVSSSAGAGQEHYSVVVA